MGIKNINLVVKLIAAIYHKKRFKTSNYLKSKFYTVHIILFVLFKYLKSRISVYKTKTLILNLKFEINNYQNVFFEDYVLFFLEDKKELILEKK